ncbi:MAG: LCP family protein, partial [Bacilli bacterium]|nr:LCP family protein [Bacilli bacterium]
MSKIIKNILNNKFFIILVMVNILYFLSNSYLIFSVFKLYNIENLIRLLLIIILFISFIFFTLKSIRFIAKRKRKRSIFLSIVMIIIFIIQCLLYNVIDKVYTSLNTISSNETLYSSSLVVLNESNINDVKELNNMKIGLYNNKESIEGYVIPKEIIKDRKLDKTNEIINYDDITALVLGLYEKEVDAILITTNYSVLFSFNGFANIKDETKILISKEKKIKVEDNTRQEITEPFTILLMGVDSTLESIKSGSAFNGDALMLITFNPKTLNATMLSIPRDTYVPIVCFENQRENKITHAAWHGEECMIKTIENFTEIKIDYYAKINFKGLVKL